MNTPENQKPIVLLTDNDRVMASAVAHVLLPRYSVVYCPGDDSILTLLQQYAIDVVLMRSGDLTLFRRVRAISAYVPVICDESWRTQMTAKTLQGLCPAFDYLPRDIDAARLLNVVEHAAMHEGFRAIG